MSSVTNPSECKVAVLCGGRSREREVSLASGKSVSEALIKEGFEVSLLDPANREDLLKLIQEPFTVAFLCTHGKYGEDGVIQGFLELIDLPYTGSGVYASALAMNKAKSKETYRQNGIPTLPSISLQRDKAFTIQEIIDELGEHCVVKVATEGSSIGLYIVEGKEAIEEAITKAFESSEEVLVERYCKGREFTVGVLGNAETKALPIIEIIPKESFYGYESKYAPGGSQHICPAELDEEITAAMQKCAEAAHAALGCKGESRSDFLMEEDGTFWILETNTLPGMTETSLLPDAASKIGMTYGDLCRYLIDLALEEH